MVIPAPLPIPLCWGGRNGADKRPEWSGHVADFIGIRIEMH